METINSTTQKSMTELVQEIHDTFNTEVDRILAEAKITLPTDHINHAIIDKAKALWELGFSRSVPVQKGREERDKLQPLQTINSEKESLRRAVAYFSLNYPNHKFITEESVKKICEKYGLVYGPVHAYEGDIPDKNVKDMQEFSIKSEDMPYSVTETYHGNYRFIKYISKEKATEISDTLNNHDHYNHYDGYKITVVEKCPWEIAAPQKDFNPDGKTVVITDFKIEILDPVVLCPVLFEDRKHYLIVTAWGPEASDELVVNEKLN